MKSALGALALGVALIAGPVSAAPEAAGLLKVDAATQARLGVATVALTPAFRNTTADGFARALDPGPLAQLDSDIETQIAAAAASRAEAVRTRHLADADHTVSEQAAEAAESQSRQDIAKLSLLRRRVGLEWSPALAKYSDAQRRKLVGDIATGKAALLRIDSASGFSPFTGPALLDLGPGGPVSARILGPARVGDPRLQSTGVLAVVTGPQAVRLGAGTVVPATVAVGAGAHGVVIPRAALLRAGGQVFVYVRRDATDFERRVVSAMVTDPEGLFVATGFRPGEQVVTAGAAQLYAAQSAPAKGAKGD